MAKIVVYFSREGENYVNGTIKNLKVGNTEIAAKLIREMTGADIFKMEPVVRYSPDYNTCIKEAQDDQGRNARPELKEYPKSLDEYDTVYLGYPNYWGTMPMAVFTFLEHYDFTGKIMKPFCTHEGSGLGSSVDDIKRLCPGAKVEKGLAIHGGSVEKAGKDIKKWV